MIVWRFRDWFRRRSRSAIDRKTVALMNRVRRKKEATREQAVKPGRQWTKQVLRESADSPTVFGSEKRGEEDKLKQTNTAECCNAYRLTLLDAYQQASSWSCECKASGATENKMRVELLIIAILLLLFLPLLHKAVSHCKSCKTHVVEKLKLMTNGNLPQGRLVVHNWHLIFYAAWYLLSEPELGEPPFWLVKRLSIEKRGRNLRPSFSMIK